LLTLFTTPKAFRDHIAVIQRNAITSWTRLEPRAQVLVIGNEEGAAEISRELGLQHIPNLEHNEFGAPLLRDLFSKAEQASRHDVLCYVNADLILLSDFPRAVERALSAAPKFLMVGRRWDVAMDRLWDFTAPEWAARLRQYVREAGAQAPPPGNSDYFCFSRGLWDSMPPLAIGRAAWDAWLIYEARRLHAGVVDASAAVMAVHQKHDQSSYPHGLRRWRAELSRNYEIAGAEAARFCLYDATHLLTAEALARPHGLPYFIRHFDTLPLFYPRLAAPLHIPRLAIAGVRRLRRELTLARGPLYRLTRLILSRLPENGITSVLGLGDAGAGNGMEGLGLRLAHGLLWYNHMQ
jgi:hypothetical protein